VTDYQTDRHDPDHDPDRLIDRLIDKKLSDWQLKRLTQHLQKLWLKRLKTTIYDWQWHDSVQL